MCVDRMDLMRFGITSSLKSDSVSLCKQGFCGSKPAEQLLYALPHLLNVLTHSKQCQRTAFGTFITLRCVTNSSNPHREHVFDHVIFQVARGKKKKNCVDATECRFEVYSFACSLSQLIPCSINHSKTMVSTGSALSFKYLKKKFPQDQGRQRCVLGNNEYTFASDEC